MSFRVDDLAARTGVRIDTIRFYQSRGLLPAPRRQGRIALYETEHLVCLRRIRGLLGQGFTLAQIAKLLDPGTADSEPLLQALVQEQVGERTYSRSELAHEAGLPEALLVAAQAANLLQPLQLDGSERFSQADLDMARAALEILNAGFPLQDLIALASDHAAAVRATAERAITLFDEHVRKPALRSAPDSPVTRAFQSLLPQVTRLVALHFQRTLVNRALERLSESGDREALRAAALAAEAATLDVAWR